MPSWAFCPRCQSRAHRSSTRGLERILKVFGIRAYRCEMCSYRFLSTRRKSKAKIKDEAAPADRIERK